MCPVHARFGGTPGRRMPARGWVAAAFVAAACLSMPVTPAAAAPVSHPAVSADAAVESIGINTKFTDTTREHCAMVPVLRAGLRDLRIRHIRDALSTWDKAMTTCTWSEGGQLRTARAIDLLTELAPEVRTLLLAGAMNRTTFLQGLTVDRVLARVDRPGPENDVLDAAEILARAEALEGLEGANEYDLAGLRTFRFGSEDFHPWRTALRAHQTGLHALVKAPERRLLNGVPLVGPALGRFRSYDAYADNGWSPGEVQDKGNLHYYTGGAHPEQELEGPRNDLGDAMEGARKVADGDPIWATEFGYHTAPFARDGFGELYGVSEEAAAAYIPRFILELERLGVERSYLFELRDHRDFGPGDPESYWGLIRWDGTRRPAFWSLARLMSALDDPGPAYQPQPLAYELTGDTEGVRTRLYGRRDGSYVLAMWRAEPVWDGPSQRRLLVPPRRVSVVLGAPERYDASVANLAVGTPAGGLRWRAAPRAAGPIELDPAGDVQLLRLSPR